MSRDERRADIVFHKQDEEDVRLIHPHTYIWNSAPILIGFQPRKGDYYSLGPDFPAAKIRKVTHHQGAPVSIVCSLSGDEFERLKQIIKSKEGTVWGVVWKMNPA